MLSFLFCRGGSGGVEDGLETGDARLGSLDSNVSSGGKSQFTRLGSLSEELNVLSSVVVCGVTQPSMVLKFIGGVEMGDGMKGSRDWGLYCSSARITAMVANTLKGLCGKLRSLRLGGMIGF